MNNVKNEAMVCGWQNCPAQIKGLVDNILDHYRETLRDNLIGFYLHGSLAMNCFNPLLSDVDFLAIVKRQLTVEQKKTIIEYLLEQRDNLPVKDIEMSIVLEEYMKHFVYPTPYELHYSNEWYQKYKSGQVDYVKQHCDKDLAAHFVITRNRGICLFGKPIEEVFPEIPKETYIQSLVYDANWICRHSEEDPLYTILNLCRALAFLKESKITSKKEGGEWALLNLPGEFSVLISSALGCYSNTDGNRRLNINGLKSFVEYSKSELDSWQET